jgi:hypothetical protein
MIAEDWVDLHEGFGAADTEQFYPGLCVVSSVSQVNSSRAVMSVLNSNEEAIEVTNLGVSATQWLDPVSVHNVESSVSDNTENILSQKRRVTELVASDHMAECCRSVILDLCEEYHDIFNLEGDKLAHTDLVNIQCLLQF